ncbi:RNA polymerase factor sigma-54 [Solimonas soli]|uniref:RNA polymerase factor sigma-54 n=1 Tax=Solimonas soli TaxID=413479 RepID=UPI0004866A91|nr:RNA polymerase factor sigma-54 [Solimonas soli]
MSQALISLSRQATISMSPRLQHAIRLLQLPAVEFEQELQNALANNPFLEESDNEGEDAVDDLPLPEGAYPDRDGARAMRGDDEWNALDHIAAPGDLHTHLRAQLDAAPLHPRDRALIELLIATLDDDGYLRDDVLANAEAAGLDPAPQPSEIDTALAFVRRLDPVGIGARDLHECLRLQLGVIDADEDDRALAQTVLNECLDLLTRRDFAAIRRRTGADECAVSRACKLLRRLDPYPGHRYSQPAAEYVVPDVIVVPRGGRLVAVGNPALQLRARLNRRYIDLFLQQNRERRSPALSQQLQEARWMLRNAGQRLVTIERVANEILRRQPGFFVHGDLALRPMQLREVAMELNLHESTVSRATSNKYMATPSGMYELKHFFSRELPTRVGSCSPASVRAVLRELIDSEDAQAPLSDVSLARMLKQQGIRVARRTVSKYRGMMKLPPAELRRAG